MPEIFSNPVTFDSLLALADLLSAGSGFGQYSLGNAIIFHEFNLKFKTHM
jgi:hypothetical protein